MALKCWGTCWENVSRNGICPGISVKWGRDTTHWIPGEFGRLSRPLGQAILCQHCSCTVHLGHLEVLPFSIALRWIAFSSPHKSLGHKKNNASFKIALWSVKCAIVFQTCSNHRLVDPLWSRCSQPKAATFFLQSSACNLFPSATSGYVGYVSFPMESSVSLQCLNGLLLLCTEGTCLILLAWTPGITRKECRGKWRKGEKDCEKTLDPTTAMTKF